MKIVDIILTKSKDRDIIRWLCAMKEHDIEFSPYIAIAVEYYLKTGGFINIGTINKDGYVPDKMRKRIYLSDASPAVAWLDELKALKKGLAVNKLKYILNNSLKYGVSDEIPEHMSLFEQFDNIGKKVIPDKQIQNADKPVETYEPAETEQMAEPIQETPPLKAEETPPAEISIVEDINPALEEEEDDDGLTDEEREARYAERIALILSPKPGDWR